MRVCLLSIAMLLFASLLMLPTVQPSTAQSPTQTAQPPTVPITLLYPDAQFTIRVDADINNLDLTALNFRWISSNNAELRFDLSANPQLRAYATSLPLRQCIQLYVAQSNLVVPLCTGGVISFPVRSNQEFWNPQNVLAFSVFQGDRSLMICTTANDSCSFDWTLSLLATPTPIPTSSVTPIDGQPDPDLLILASDNELILMVTAEQPISVVGLRYGVAISTNTQARYALLDYFDALELVNEIVEPNACYILQRAGSNDVPPVDCDTALTYRRLLNDSDVFWYDTVRNEGRSIGVYYQDFNIVVCPTLTIGCAFTYDSELLENLIEPTTPTLTILPPNSKRLDVFYNSANFYVNNLSNTDLVVSNLRFEAVTSNRIVTRTFNGNLWALYYSFLEKNRACVEIDTSSATRQPNNCRAMNSSVTFYSDPFWVEHDNAVEFEVSWNGVVVGRCPLATSDEFLHCDIYVQP